MIGTYCGGRAGAQSLLAKARQQSEKRSRAGALLVVDVPAAKWGAVQA
jgi:hypothetical protein